MSPGRWAALAAFLVVAVFVGLAFSEGVFDSAETLSRRAEPLDGGVLEEWPFLEHLEEVLEEDAGTTDAGAKAIGQHDGPSLGLDGRARLALDHFANTDKQHRHVLRVRHLRAAVDMSAMKKGDVHVSRGHIEGAEITLYRDKTGKMSIANAFRKSEPPEEHPEASEAEKEEGQGPGWVIHAGPIILKDVVLKLGFTAKPVSFRVDHGTMHVRKTFDDSAPIIYFDHIRGVMLEPKPLPTPVRIAHAKGVVRMKGRPMVEMVAQTCLGSSEMRLRAVVPARKHPVELTGDSAGAGGLLGRMSLLITSKVKSEKITYEHDAVKIEGGPGCKDSVDATAGEPEARDAGVSEAAIPDSGARND